MNKQEQLAVAIQIAVSAHNKQYDKGGKPYILHPLHLMNQLMFDLQLATIAVLHDVVEDSQVEFKDLERLGMSSRVLSALMVLTHKSTQSYDDYIDGVCTNFDAVRVKLKDLEHNSDITRLKVVEQKDIDRMVKYHKAFVQLTKAKRCYERT